MHKNKKDNSISENGFHIKNDMNDDAKVQTTLIRMLTKYIKREILIYKAPAPKNPRRFLFGFICLNRSTDRPRRIRRAHTRFYLIFITVVMWEM